MDTIKRLEANLIDFISGVTPWLAPLIPAFLVYTNMTGRLGYPPIFGLIGAASVEFLGLASVHTAITFWRWNDAHKSERAPFWIALGAGAFYVSIVLLVNAGLDIWQGQAWARIAAHALLSLLSVDAAIIIAIRAQHARMLKDRDDAKAERKAARHGATHDATPATMTQSDATQATRDQFMTQWQANGHKSIASLAHELNVNTRTAQRWVKQSEEN